MFCVTCGLRMSDDVAVCPRCGKVMSVQSNFQADDALTEASEYSDSPAASPRTQTASPFPTTDYGPAVNPYGMPPPPPDYNGMNPYSLNGATPYPPVPAPPLAPPYAFPPPVRPSKRGNKVIFIVGGVLLVFALLCGTATYLGATLVGTSIQQISKHITPISSTRQATVEATASPASQEQNSDIPQTGTLIMNDSMHDNSQGNKWDEATMNDNNSNAVCGYKSNSYHISRGTRGSLICNPEATQLMTLANLTFEVTVTVVQGSEAGVAARFDQVKGVGYVFIITTDGHYVIDTMDFNNSDPNKHFVTLRQGSNSVIKQGLNQSNILALVANGSSISAFVNHQFVDRVTDTLFTNGQIGIYGYGDPGADISAQNARVWRI